jgi:ubiquinone/menaquinone biosynthesis C-methylase UbiE
LHTGVAVSDQAPDWRSYDSVAEPYARVRASHHTLLARDLVALVAPAFRGRVLDVGAGTGIAAEAALGATGADGTVVAIDPSIEMLRRIERRGRIPAAVGGTPDLPFGADGFDAVVANLVIADVPDYAATLADMARVLRPGGRLGVSVWGALGDAPPVDDGLERAAYEVWSEAAAAVADPDAVERAAQEALPWGNWFADPAHLRAALAEAGLERVELTGRAYRYRLSHADWLAAVGTSAKARYLHHTLGDDEWGRFGTRVLDGLRGAVADPIPCVDEALLAVGNRPG